MPKAKSLAKTKSNLPVNAAMYEEDLDTGYEETGSEDYAIPFLKLLHALSPYCKKTDGAYVQGAEQGRFLNTISSSLADKVELVFSHYVNIFIEWRPKSEGGGFVAQYTKEEGRKMPVDSEWKLENGNILSDTRMFYVLAKTDGIWEPVVVSLSSTQIKKAKGLMTRIRNITTKSKAGKIVPYPMYAHVFEASSVEEGNEKGDWAGWKFDRLGFNEDEEVYLQAKAFVKQVKGGDIKVDQNQNAEGAPEESDDY